MKARAQGIINIASPRSVDETVEKLRNILEAKGVTLFALVDHSGEAAKAGMAMPPTKLLIFGSPKAGTPIMLAAPKHRHRSAAQDPRVGGRSGKVWISYNSADYLRERHNVPSNCCRTSLPLRPSRQKQPSSGAVHPGGANQSRKRKPFCRISETTRVSL